MQSIDNFICLKIRKRLHLANEFDEILEFLLELWYCYSTVKVLLYCSIVIVYYTVLPCTIVNITVLYKNIMFEFFQIHLFLIVLDWSI